MGTMLVLGQGCLPAETVRKEKSEKKKGNGGPFDVKLMLTSDHKLVPGKCRVAFPYESSDDEPGSKTCDRAVSNSQATLRQTSTYIREGFLAAFMIADMRLFTRVGPRMDGQRTALDKTLIAVLYGAVIRAFIGVYSVVSAEI